MYLFGKELSISNNSIPFDEYNQIIWLFNCCVGYLHLNVIDEVTKAVTMFELEISSFLIWFEVTSS